MDIREALKPGSILEFNGMRCSVIKEIGRGSNAIVYEGSYPDLLNREEEHYVLIKELFPFHPENAIYRNESDEIVCLPAGRTVYEVHRHSFEYGNIIHLKMLKKHPDIIGANINTFSYGKTEYTVLGYSGGRTLDTELSGAAENLKQLTVRMLGLLDALDAFHESGFLHLDISPDNILLIGKEDKERVMLIDYNSVCDINTMRNDPSIHYSIKQGYTAPEIRAGKLSAIGPSSDLYSVAAVFYRCLSGTPLTAFQTIRPTPPDISGCVCLDHMPDSVVSMVKQILYIGLQSIPRKRYQDISEMRRAFRELLDRIEGIGITHWSLYEAGKKTVQKVIRSNPSFSYLTDADAAFPENVVMPENRILTMDAYLDLMSGENGVNTILTASGGMGKTTAMLRAMMKQSSGYSVQKPAMVYISLYGWKDGSATYIQDRILENLQYTAETVSYENARQVLHHVMETPLKTKEGNRPSLFLFLDGFNEINGSGQTLIEEVLSLASLEGVRILLTSRTEIPLLPFRQVTLVPLSRDDVAEILGRHRLLMPESEKVQELLRTPLMLSAFLCSAEAEQKQILVTSQEELLDSYFHALRQKEFAGTSESADIRWQIDAALEFVLPEIAETISAGNEALSDAELLKIVSFCYRLFSAPLLRRAFPEWIGHSRAIRGDAGNAEEWYGLIVHDILWKRMGLLVRNEHGMYRIIHQTISEYLMEKYRHVNHRIRQKRKVKAVLIGGMTALLIFGAAVFYRIVIAPPAYPEMLADLTMGYGMMSYQNFCQQYEQLTAVMECVENVPDRFDEQMTFYRNYLFTFPKEAEVEAVLQKMLSEGKVMPWSGKTFQAEAYRDLIELTAGYTDEYARLLQALTDVMHNEKAYARWGKTYSEQLSELFERDVQIVTLLYQASCREHLRKRYDRISENNGNDAASAEVENYRRIMEDLSETNQYFMENASEGDIFTYVYEELYAPRVELKRRIISSGVLQYHE